MDCRWLLTTLAMAVALAGSGLGAWLACHHPLWPGVSLASFVVCALSVARWPMAWFFVVPAALPLLNFSPWTGWLAIEEFDLLVLGVIAGGYARLAVLRCSASRRWSAELGDAFFRSESGRRQDWLSDGLLLGLALSGLLALWRGLSDAGGGPFGWFDGYSAPLNSVRVSKSLVYALLLTPLIRGAMRRDTDRPMRLFGSGVLAGLAVTSLAVLWERHAFAGLFDFTSRYRTTALFWEMHVGGAAIDAYLAMTLPFLVWALAAVRRPVAWLAVALLAVAAVYAVMTTFSRGVYLAVALPLAGLVVGHWYRSVRSGFGLDDPAPRGAAPQPRWKVLGSALLGVVLLMEATATWVGGTYLSERMGTVDRDFAKRLDHWRHGLNLLSTPTDWLVGIGLGRLPARYASQVAGGEFSGDVAWRQEPEPAANMTDAGMSGFVRLQGPASNPMLGAWYALTRRIELVPGLRYRVELDVRAEVDVEIGVRVCERHLLFEGACQRGRLRTGGPTGGWQHRSLVLSGPSLSSGSWPAPRLGMLSLSVLGAARSVDLARVSLGSAGSTGSVSVGDFSRDLSAWFPAAQVYFSPWHIDNLYLELLIERGGLGLVLTVWAVALGVRRAATRQGGAARPLHGVLIAGMTGGLLVGMVGSVMDVPRVAFLLLLMVSCSIESQNGTNSR